MKTYYCPECGNGLESKELIKRQEIIVCFSKHECPRCQKIIIPVLSGASLIMAGIFFLLTMGMILEEVISAIGIIIGSSFFGLGIIRSFSQLYKSRKYSAQLRMNSHAKAVNSNMGKS